MVAVTGMVVVPFGTAVAERLPGSDHGGLAESATLLASNTPLDLPGSGTAQITINPGQDEVCFHITVSNLTGQAIAAHIHKNGSTQGCVTVMDRSLLNQIISDPAGFYVNVHTFQHQSGEIRGQLTKGQ
jgi:Cu/Zn superoxide dismutase